MAIINIQHSAPGYGVGVDIEPRELADLLIGQVVRVGFVNPEFLETTEHHRGELADAVFLGDEAAEEGFILLGVLVEHPGLDGGS